MRPMTPMPSTIPDACTMPQPCNRKQRRKARQPQILPRIPPQIVSWPWRARPQDLGAGMAAFVPSASGAGVYHAQRDRGATPTESGDDSESEDHKEGAP